MNTVELSQSRLLKVNFLLQQLLNVVRLQIGINLKTNILKKAF